MKIFISGETMRNASGEQEASEVKTSGSEKKKPNRNTSNKIFGTTLFFHKMCN